MSGLAKHLLDPDHLWRFGLILRAGRIIAPNQNDRVFIEKDQVQQLSDLIEGIDRPSLHDRES